MKNPQHTRGRTALNAVAAATLFAVASGAHAQSSVTLYGLISTGLQYVNNSGGHSLYSLANGGMQPPRWGLKGSEDLGGGTHAIFTLENGFSITNGSLSSGLEFGRQAFVGLTNDRYGTLTFGRQYEEMAMQLWWAESGNIFSGLGTHIGDTDNQYNTQRFNNSVRYASPKISGLSFAADYGFSNSTGFSNNNAYSFGANYVTGSLKLGAALSQFNRRGGATPSNLTAGAVDNSGYGFASPFVTSRGGAPTDQQRIFGFGAGYDFGFLSATLNYTNVLFNYSDSTGLRVQNAEISLWKQFTPAWLVGVAYIYTFGTYSDGTKPRYHQANLGTLYSLSKRTDLFMFGVYQQAAGDAQHAQIYSATPSSTNKQLLIEAGIRHRF